MGNLPANLPDLCRKAGLEVVVVDGWQSRGRPGSFNPVGVLNHHTGSSARGWDRARELAYAKWMFLVGRDLDLDGDNDPPLCHIALGRSGTVYIGAAGRANHGGVARASGSVAAGDANTLYIGIEWMLSGSEPIPDEMMAAGSTLNAVLISKVTETSVMAISCHFQTSITGKWDIGDPNGVRGPGGAMVLDVPEFRSRVARRIKALNRPPKVERHLRLIGWNPKVGRRPKKVRRALRKMIRRHKPHVIGLQEAKGYREMLERSFKNYDTEYSHGSSDEAGTIVTMTRKPKHASTKTFTKVLRNHVTWTGPKAGKRHSGRQFLKTRRNWWEVTNIHRTRREWSAGGAAFEEEAATLRKADKDNDAPVKVSFGDQNMGTRPGNDRTDPASPYQVAKSIGAKIYTTKEGTVDWGYAKGVKDGRVKNLGSFGSDHDAMLYEFTALIDADYNE